MNEDSLHILKSVATVTEQLKGLESVTHTAIYKRVSALELESLRRIVAHGHDSHDCPNGTSPDGHCPACMDRYWQTKGPELQDQVFALEQELATYRLWLATFFEFVKSAPRPERPYGKSPAALLAAEKHMSDFLNSILGR
jgi:hypothetical protein